MKMKTTILITSFLISIQIFCQHITSDSIITYLPLRLYKIQSNKILTKNDSINFKFKNGDTLVRIKSSEINWKLLKSSRAFFSKRAYMPLRQYKRRFKKPITKEDSLNFKYKNNDTLVLLKNYIPPKGIQVTYETKDSTFLEIYKDIIYRKHHRNKVKNQSNLTMRYWKSNIKIHFTKSVNKSVERELKKFAKLISKEIDSLNITFVNKLEKSNYLIYGYNTEDDYKYEKRIKNNTIDYYITWDGQQRIYDCKLQINSNFYDNNSDLILKSKKMFLQSLGHFNYTSLLPKESYLSILYYEGKTFSKEDLEILKYHYSYGICKGTNLKEFEKQHYRAIKSLSKKNSKYYIIHTY